MKLFIPYFHPTFCHIPPLRSKCFCQYQCPVRPVSTRTFLPQNERPSCTPIRKEKTIYIYICILIREISTGIRNDKRFEPNRCKHSPNLIRSYTFCETISIFSVVNNHKLLLCNAIITNIAAAVKYFLPSRTTIIRYIKVNTVHYNQLALIAQLYCSYYLIFK
jgi:hypothetical protein